jgi:hypothetical protein
LTPQADSDQPGLFDLSPPPPPPPASRSGRGRARETWARTVTAEVTVVDRRVLRDEAVRRLDTGIVIGEYADDDPDLTDPHDDVAASCAAAVQWCLEPTEGLWPLLEGALRIDQVEMATTDEGPARVRASWTVTVRITDAAAVRELARAACPEGDDDARADVDAGFAAAWNRAADPYAPLHPIPGITWAPAGVEVEHRLRRPTR